MFTSQFNLVKQQENSMQQQGRVSRFRKTRRARLHSMWKVILPWKALKKQSKSSKMKELWNESCKGHQSTQLHSYRCLNKSGLDPYEPFSEAALIIFLWIWSFEETWDIYCHLFLAHRITMFGRHKLQVWTYLFQTLSAHFYFRRENSGMCSTGWNTEIFSQ